MGLGVWLTEGSWEKFQLHDSRAIREGPRNTQTLHSQYKTLALTMPVGSEEYHVSVPTAAGSHQGGKKMWKT